MSKPCIEGDYSWLRNGRYIFFSALDNFIDHSDAGQDIIYRSSKILEQGKSRLPQLEVSSTNFSSLQPDNFSKIINQYITYLQAVQKQLQTAESNILNANQEIIKSAFSEPTEVGDLIEKLKSGGINEKEYRSIITFFNIIEYKDINELNNNLKQAQNRMSTLQEAYNELDSQSKKIATREYITQTYSPESQRMMKKIMRDKGIDPNSIFTSASKKLSDILNEKFNELENNQDFKNKLLSIYQENPNIKKLQISGKEFSELIISHILKIAYDARNETETEIISKIDAFIEKITDKNQDFSDLVINTDDLNFMNLIQSTYDEVIANGGAAALLEYIKRDEKKARDFFEHHPDYSQLLEDKDWEKLIEAGNNLNKKENEFKNFCKALKDKQQGRIKALKGLKNPRKSYLARKENRVYNTDDDTRKILGQFANDMKIEITKDAFAEKITAEHAKDIGEAVFLMKPGKKIQLKDDIFYIIYYPLSSTELASKILTEDDGTTKTLEKKIDEIIEGTLGQFLTEYNKKGETSQRGETDVVKAKKTYDRLLQACKDQISDALENLDLNEDDWRRIWEKLKNTTMGSNSVKDYVWYNTDLGYHGGSLGGSDRPDGVIKNIMNMYEAGGISPMDVDQLKFAVLNCANAAIGENLKVSLENFLLGGAAIMMFDETAVFSKEYLDNIVKNVEVDTQHLTLYFLDLTYIPASYVLNNIIQSIQQFYAVELNSKINTTIKQRSEVHIINDASYDKYEKNQDENFQTKMTHVSNTAWDEIKIKLMFMAGMLDIIQSITDRLSINKIK